MIKFWPGLVAWGMIEPEINFLKEFGKHSRSIKTDRC
jgi:hypothetical protein